MSDGLENALSVRWAFGFRHGVKNGVQNLTTGDRSAIFFLSSHSGERRAPPLDASSLCFDFCLLTLMLVQESFTTLRTGRKPFCKGTATSFNVAPSARTSDGS